MKIASWNVNSIRSRLDHCIKFIEEYDIDVLCLQELKCEDKDFPAMDFQFLGYNCYYYGQKSYNGVAIITKKDAEGVEYGFSDNSFEEQKRIIKATVDGVDIYNIYAPNGTDPLSEKFEYKEAWFKRLTRMIRFESEIDDRNVVLCGDFNIAPDDRDVYDPKKLLGQICFHPKEHEWFKTLIQTGLIDCYREFEKSGDNFTWWNYIGNGIKSNKGMRLDHFLVNENALKKIKNCDIIKEPRFWEKPSDHTPIILEIE